jgi:hypothetical protein
MNDQIMPALFICSAAVWDLGFYRRHIPTDRLCPKHREIRIVRIETVFTGSVLGAASEGKPTAEQPGHEGS